MADLKKCPFCGCQAAVFGGGDNWGVYCTNVNCIAHDLMPYYSDEFYAVKAWNRRYAPHTEIDFDYEAED